MTTNFPPIDWVGLADALLDRAYTLVPQWLPAGFQKGEHWYVGDFDGSAGKSANVNLKTGQWFDNAGAEEDKGGDLIALYARIHGMNNGQAARELMRMLGWERDEDQAGPARVQTSALPEPPPWTEGEPAPADAPATDAPAAAVPAAAAKTKGARWLPITLVPAHAPQPTFKFGYKDVKRGGAWVDQEAVRTWRYELDGQLFGFVARYERIASDGVLVKETVPWTWCEDQEHDRRLQRWATRQWIAPRPLYVPAATLRSELPVVIVEGEKCAEAGHALLGDEFDFISWPGGCKTWQLANWLLLMGRTVHLWPDCDAQRESLTKAERESNVDPETKPFKTADRQPGMRAMVGLGSRLMVDVKCAVFMCEVPPPGFVAGGWDIADAIAEGWSAERVRNFIRCAPAFVPPEPEVRAALGIAVEKAPRSIAAAEVDDVDAPMAWRKKLSTSDKGAIYATRENVVVALDGEGAIKGIPEVEGLIAFNEFTNNVVKTRASPWGTPAGAWEETDELLMGMWLVREHQMPSMTRSNLEEAVLMVARLHSYHPVRAEVEACRGTWDGTPRLASWLERVCMKEGELTANDPLKQYLSRVGTWLMMAICVRVLPLIEAEDHRIIQGPGTKFDYMTIFEGPQGWGKSTLASVLGGRYFADTGIEMGNKDSYQNLQGIRVYEMGELDALTRQEVTKVKQFISSQKDRFRASFDRRPKDYPRQVVFIGTTNEDHYLTDPTGNRRMWPVRITRPVDIAWVRANLVQMTAEAVELIDNGERFHPTPAEQKKLFDPQQQQRTVESAVESAIRAYLYDQDQKVPHGGINGALLNQIGLTDLLTRIGFSVDKQTDVIVKKTGAVMKRLGWTVRRLSDEGRPRVYVRPSPTEPDAARGSDGSSSPAQGEQPARLTDDCPL